MNKYQEALNTLKSKEIKLFAYKNQNNVIEEHQPTLFDFYHSEIFILQELVDKETPKKVVSNTNIEPYWVCPVCGNFLIEKSEARNLKPFVKHVFLEDYCHKCGQKLDWSDVNE